MGAGSLSGSVTSGGVSQAEPPPVPERTAVTEPAMPDTQKPKSRLLVSPKRALLSTVKRTGGICSEGKVSGVGQGSWDAGCKGGSSAVLLVVHLGDVQCPHPFVSGFGSSRLLSSCEVRSVDSVPRN